MQRTLVILTPGFAADEGDSTCLPPQQIFVLALKEADPKLNIIILTFQYPFVSQPYTWNGINVIPFNGHNKGKFNRVALWLNVATRFRRLRREQDIVGIISFWCGECALLGKYLGKYYSTKHFCWILGQDAKKENKYISLIRPKPQELIAMSEFLQDAFYRNHGIKPKYIVPNGIDEKRFPSSSNHRDIDILGVGSLITLKQFDIFIRIVRDLRTSIPTINASIVGKGPQKDNLMSMIDYFVMADNVNLEGERPHNIVLEMMTRTRILLHTSNYEGSSTVCLEALFAGAHVVSFCRPHPDLQSHWHIVNTEAEMLLKAEELLLDAHLDNSSQTAFSMIDSARAILHLYN